jgi:hypothetical protein
MISICFSGLPFPCLFSFPSAVFWLSFCFSSLCCCSLLPLFVFSAYRLLNTSRRHFFLVFSFFLCSIFSVFLLYVMNKKMGNLIHSAFLKYLTHITATTFLPNICDVPFIAETITFRISKLQSHQKPPQIFHEYYSYRIYSRISFFYSYCIIL